MQFVKVQLLLEGVPVLAERLAKDLSAGRQVLWLLSGGSNIDLAVSVMEVLDSSLTLNLTVMLMDERYGVPGHADSNDQKLQQAGFDPKQAQWIQVLQPDLSLADTCAAFAVKATAAFGKVDVVIGQFGMGDDGHTAGILPGSPAAKSADFASSYIAKDFQRITLTPKALTSVTVAYLFAAGAKKRGQLEKLESQDIAVSEQPVQILKQLPEVYVYNDQIGQSDQITQETKS